VCQHPIYNGLARRVAQNCFWASPHQSNRRDYPDIHTPWPDESSSTAGRRRTSSSMKGIIDLLTRFTPHTFKLNYSPGYKTFLVHHAASDPLHPMHILRRRQLAARKHEGLWWHVTTGVDLSKSGVVRSWCRKRLRNAFTEGLKERGFDEFGRLANVAILRGYKGFEHIPERDGDLSLTGSLRLHISPALLTAKYADVRKETGAMITILLEGVKADESWLRRTAAPSRPHAQSGTFPQARAPSRYRQATSEVLPNTHSQQVKLSQFNLPSQTKAPSSKIRFRVTPSTPLPKPSFTRRQPQQPDGSVKPRWHGWGAQ
jgi:hypothetical protein